MRAYGAAPWRVVTTLATAALALSLVTACSSGGKGSSGSPGGASPTPTGTGDDSDGATAPPVRTNPDGFAYPSPPFGRNARSGSTPGSRMQNFAYLGYPNGDPSQGLQTIAMIDYYDPCGKRFKLIHLSVAAVWCTPCNQETAAVVAARADLDAEHVVMLQALDDGPTVNVGATQHDLDLWIARYRPAFSEVLDPGLIHLGGFFPAAEVPWNCDIDPRTMEIIDQSTGWSDVTTELSPALAAVQGPPAYPLSVSCN